MPPAGQPTRDGVTVDRFGHVTVPAKPSRWSRARYRETYDADPMALWVLYPDGARALFHAGGPLSAGALIHGLSAGALHLVEWGRVDDGQPVFPAELVERAASHD